MREYIFPLGECLKNGLRPRDDVQSDTSYLTQVSNFKPYSGSLVAAQKYTRSFAINEDAQIFRTSKGVFILTLTTLNSYASSTLTPLLTGITAGGRWSCLDFGALIIFSNGSVNLKRNTTTGVFTSDTGTIMPLAGAACNAQGRAVLGDIKTGSETNKVMWSDIGSLRFVSSADPSLAMKNTSGFTYMPWAGTVYLVLPLGARVAVYGSGGVSLLLPAAVEYAAGAMGLREIDRVGVPSRSAALAVMDQKGNIKGHYFISNDGNLYYLGDTTDQLGKVSLEVKMLGYKEFITSASSSTLSYDRLLDEVILSNANDSLIITQKGAGKISAKISDISYDPVNGTLVHSPAAIVQTDATFTTDSTDLEWPGVKTIQGITVHTDSLDVISIGIDYIPPDGTAFVTGDWYPTNFYKYGFIGISGHRFKFKVKVASYNPCKIYGVKIGVKFDDKRFVMGAGLNDNKTSS